MKPHPDFVARDMPRAFSLGPYDMSVLCGADLDEDYAAVMASADVLRGIFGGTWPDGLTREADLIDLHWHEREFSAKRSFAWVIRQDGAYLGCAYVVPHIGALGAGDLAIWIIDCPDRQAHLSTLVPAFKAWLAPVLPPNYDLTLITNAAF